MRVVVTGATSFIGSHAVRLLCSQGYEVCAVIRPESAGRKNLPDDPHLSVTECGLSGLKNLRSLPEGPGICRGAGAGRADYWLHLGWDGSGSENRRLADVQSANAVYALDALETAAAFGCRRFLFCGSQAEYGVRNTLMTETDACHPLSEYGKAKAAVCTKASERSGALGIDYIHTRIFSVYGPGDHPWSLVESCLRTFQSRGRIELGDCTQLWNYLYISDAVRVLVQLLTGEAPAGIYNVAGEDTRPLRSFIEEMYELCGRKGSFCYGKRPPNAEGVTSLNPDIRRLKGATGFCQQVSFADGIRSMLK